VDDGFRPPLLDGAGGLQRRLDRADPATERVEPVEQRELALGGGDYEHGERLRRTLLVTLPSRWLPPVFGLQSGRVRFVDASVTVA
jgi:hypothetical protein